MKHKKEKGQVSVYSSIAAVSGPKPDIKVKKHFESTWKEKKKTYGATASKPIDNLPCIHEEQEEPTITQKSRSKIKYTDDKKKLTKNSRIQPQPSRLQRPNVPGRILKNSGDKQQKKHIQLNVKVPAVSADTTSSSGNTIEQKTTNTPVTSFSELQLEDQVIINKGNTQADFDQMLSFNAAYQSEIDMLYSDKPSCPVFSQAPCNSNFNRAVTWNPSLVCKLLNKPYGQMLNNDIMEHTSMEGTLFTSKAFNNYNVSDHNNVSSIISSSDASAYRCNSTCEKSGKKLSEVKSAQVLDIQTELLRWRREKRKKEESAKKHLSINTISIEDYGRGKKNLQKTPVCIELHEEVEEESGSESSYGGK
ncbi:hypothetical protein L9F63_018560, partial [Diploptera punctata]